MRRRKRRRVASVHRERLLGLLLRVHDFHR
jgi:hypothetical protein